MLEGYVAVIQAGGRGMRLLGLTKDKIPKPMLSMNGKPMLEWQIENVKKCGIRKIVIIIGHLGEKVRNYFGDGRRCGVSISYIEETGPLGSAGALYYLKGIWKSGKPVRNFFLIYGDVMFDVDLERMARFHEHRRALATLAVHPNTHPFDSDLVRMDREGRVTDFDEKGGRRDYWYGNLVNAGIFVLSHRLLDRIREPVRLDLEKDLLMPLVRRGDRAAYQGGIYGYRTTEYIRDAGTPERYVQVSGEQRDGLWEKKNLGNRQKCIFLDRDGTLNVYKGLLADIDAFELEKGAAEAVRRINRSGFLAIVVTNQPVVARGMCEMRDVEEIHRKMETLLGEQGAYLDDIAFCPHHPDRGFPGENPAFKIRCRCRKPDIGMLETMAERYNISLTESFMVGDSTVDMQMGVNAGMKTILLRSGMAGRDGKYSVEADYEADSILEAVEWIPGIACGGE